MMTKRLGEFWSGVMGVLLVIVMILAAAPFLFAIYSARL